MKHHFIPLLISFAILSYVSGVHSQGKSRRTPVEGSGSGLGPGVDDEDRGGSQLPAGGSLFKKPPKKKAPRRPPISPSDRIRWTAASSSQPPASRSAAGGVLPETGRWPSPDGANRPPFRTASTPPQQQVRSQADPNDSSGGGGGGKRRTVGGGLVAQLPQQGDEGSGAGATLGGREAPPDQERTPPVRRKLPPRPAVLPTGPRKATQPAEMPMPCKDAVLQRRQLHYFPRCDAAGRYERRQCSRTDCMCVSPDTGIVLEKTLAMREKNISCDEVRYLIQLPLKRRLNAYESNSLFQSKVLALLESLLDNLPGLQRLEFQRYLPFGSPSFSGMEVLCRSVGHSDSSALGRFLRTQAAKGSLPFVDARRLVNVTRLMSSSPALKDTNSLGNAAHEQLNAAKDTPADETDPNAPRNDESQAGSRQKKTGAAAFLQQPGIIAAIIGGGIAGFFLAILLILFCIYRIRKKDEGSYALEEPKKMPVSAAVYHSAPTREYYA